MNISSISEKTDYTQSDCSVTILTAEGPKKKKTHNITRERQQQPVAPQQLVDKSQRLLGGPLLEALLAKKKNLIKVYPA